MLRYCCSLVYSRLFLVRFTLLGVRKKAKWEVDVFTAFEGVRSWGSKFGGEIFA
jgi:hypothetical protein